MLCRAGARQIAEAVLAGIRFTSARTPLLVAARALGAAVALATALLWPALTGAAAAATSSGSVAVVALAWAYPVDPPPAAHRSAAAGPRRDDAAARTARQRRAWSEHRAAWRRRPGDGVHGPPWRGSARLGSRAAARGSLAELPARQLLAFRSGARATDAGQPMQPIVQRLGLGEMIAVAAYVAAQPP